MNFPLDVGLRPYAGVDVTYPQRWLWEKKLETIMQMPPSMENKRRKELLRLKLNKRIRIIKRWNWCFMGTRPSPILAITTYLAEELIRGNTLDPVNPLKWNKIIFNIP